MEELRSAHCGGARSKLAILSSLLWRSSLPRAAASSRRPLHSGWVEGAGFSWLRLLSSSSSLSTSTLRSAQSGRLLWPVSRHRPVWSVLEQHGIARQKG